MSQTEEMAKNLAKEILEIPADEMLALLQAFGGREAFQAWQRATLVDELRRRINARVRVDSELVVRERFGSVFGAVEPSVNANE